jgi:hypothetical protein
MLGASQLDLDNDFPQQMLGTAIVVTGKHLSTLAIGAKDLPTTAIARLIDPLPIRRYSKLVVKQFVLQKVITRSNGGWRIPHLKLGKLPPMDER